MLAALQGLVFQPATNSSDPVIHGDNHVFPYLAGLSLDASSSSYGFSQLIAQMTARLTNQNATNPSGGLYVPAGPFFERGELSEIGTSLNALFGMSDPMGLTAGGSNKTLVQEGVDTYRTFDHSREELFRRIAELICTRGDTFTVYTVGESILQSSTTAAMKVTGTNRMRVTFRLVPMLANDKPFSVSPMIPADVIASNRFTRPDHYACSSSLRQCLLNTAISARPVP